MKVNKPDQEIRKMKQEFLKAMRLHNKIRKMELKQNPHQYAKNDPRAAQGKSGFSSEVANGYFQTTYEGKKHITL